MLAALPLLVLAAPGCGGAEESDPPAPASSDVPEEAGTGRAAATPKYEGPRGPIDLAQTGTITGVVRFEGDSPERKELSIGGTGGCPHHAEPVFEESVVVADGRVANVFVWIKDGLDGWEIPPSDGRTVDMDQKGCLYLPHVLGMRAGETLLVHNSDLETTHNVNIRSRSNDSLNPVQPPNGQPVEWRPRKREIGVSFECNLHPWMKAWVCVVDHPWHAVTAADGSFVLEGVPPGEYVIEAWHEKLGKKTRNVALEPAGSAEAGFTYRATDKGR